MSGLKDYLVRVEPVDADRPLSSFAGALMTHGAVPVMHKDANHGPRIEGAQPGQRLLGLVQADLVADREHPKTTKARSMVSHPSLLMLDTSVEEAAARLVEEQVRALPVIHDDKLVGMVTERSLVDVPEIKADRRTIETIASDPWTVDEACNLGHARAMMREKRIGRLPVVYETGGLAGILEWTHLVLVEAKQDRDRRLVAQEPRPSSRLPVTVAMDTRPLTVGNKDPVGLVAGRMKEMDRSAAVLVEGRKPVGIVTCGDLLEPVGARFARSAQEGIYVQITGLDGMDPFDRSAMDRVIRENLDRFSHSVKDPEFLYLHVKRYEEDGNRQKWSVRARLADGKGTLNARAHGYDLMEAVDRSMHRLGRIVVERRELRRERQREGSPRQARRQET